ncbi:nitroreductase family deazaflavin-dependent oxidoreductase [Amycolatopsis sp. PS_44_ISF1]|uniref:nitroreductase family deazaflavin-dependent oxidoreductase n=1 Tax=Amycolatopsis sp. PS_44_ISF1 TaxID=2974917 RepID=UPI0028DEC415|nr:nitroreductase family deazaflavin-dependent oxidoreductase [Amycolatopsis sp. PS_44_ISF1]MDT8910056.1 nitroreductase family deazaflavin-dependent oxidoreductase [Amycolatopsis sp. PS_44_ISF1]
MTEEIDFDAMNRQVIADFRANGGEPGGMTEGSPMVLVHHVGAKSGAERIAPLVPYVDGDRLYIFASKGGSPGNPAWYHNLLAHPDTKVEYRTETFPVHVRVLSGQERDDIYAKQVAVQPQFGDYQRNTDRIIPVLELERTGR